MSAKLYLIPCPIGENAPIEMLPISIKTTITNTNFFIVEHEKEARRFIKKVCPDKIQSKLKLFPLNKYTSVTEMVNYLDPCKFGENMGLISDAGCPAIADPGAIIVEKAHQLGIKVKPLVGPSAILMAMMSSGMNGQNFAFNGYVPINKNDRKKNIKDLESRSQKQNQSQIFIEAPYRNEKLFMDLIDWLSPETMLCIAYGITESDEYIKTYTISDWKKKRLKFHKKPAIFILHKKDYR
jgi:16S rRNA (cytidine1402-2'-O)-methyltransferase